MKDEKQPAVYLLANRPRGTTYVGVTSALWNRVLTHKTGGISGFSAEQGLKSLVWYEHHHTMEAAIKREKQIKKWNRDWKVKMVEELNPAWIDLHELINPNLFYDESKLGSRLRGNDEV